MKTKMSLVSKFASVLVLVIASSFIFCHVYTAYGGSFDKIMQKKSVGHSESSVSKGDSNVSKNDLVQLYFLVAQADKLLQKSVDTLFKMLANKDDRQMYEMQLKAILEIRDPKEQRAEMKKFINDWERKFEENLKTEEMSRRIESLSAEQRQLFANAIFNLFLAGLRDGQAVEKAKQLVQIIRANPLIAVSFVGDLDKLAYIVTTLPPQAIKTLQIGTNLVRLAQANKIELALPKSSEEKPRAVEDLDQEQAPSDTKKEKPNEAASNLSDKQQSPERSKETEPSDKRLSPDTKMEEAGVEDKRPSPDTKMVIITWTLATIHSGAGIDFPIVANAKKGDRLIVISENGEWLNVRSESGQQGWVKKMVCKLI